MVRILSVVLIVSSVVLIAIGVVNIYDDQMSVGRMWKTPAIKPHEKPIPVMAPGSVPLAGGEALYQTGPAGALEPPFPLSDPSAITGGKLAYRYYCVHCHGPGFDGYGTVGQSFAPRPRDLRSAQVQAMPVGRVFREISYGIPDGRQPALATTVSVQDRWRVIAFIRSLGQRD
jgi:mono/diheme cytochrome c family protein